MKTVFINGSPKKKMSVSGHLLRLLSLTVGGEVVKEHVRNQADHARVLETLKGADNVVFGLPLFVDGLPSRMLMFLQEMEAFCREQHIQLNVYVLSNGGFIEGKQSEPLMRVFECFCERSGLTWRGGIGIGGGVMLNVLRIIFFVYLGIFVLNLPLAGLAGAFEIFAPQAMMILFFHLGVLFYGVRMGLAVRRGQDSGVHYTRVLLPSFVFVLVADVFFTIISIFQGGVFRGWLAKK